MSLITLALSRALSTVATFSSTVLHRPLRQYQAEPAQAIIDAILHRDTDLITIRFPRQSGKNETLAHAQAYALFLWQRAGGAMIHTAPTLEPQAKNAMQRLVSLTAGNPWFTALHVRDNTVSLGKASITFISGMPRDVPLVGLTASLAMFYDEAQDLDETYCERAFAPMTVSTNAPSIYTGTARHTSTWLAHQRQRAEQMQEQDGRRRVFIVNWRDVAKEVPAYKKAVLREITLRGANHPSIISEYENVETKESGRLFDQRRVALMRTAIQRAGSPTTAGLYVATVDVGGADPLTGEAGKHDSTVVAIHRVATDPINAFTTIDYLTLTGANVLDDTPDRRRLIAFLRLWNPARIVIDATGLGNGLASHLLSQFPQRVTPFVFTSKSKSQLMERYLALIETGRYHHYDPAGDDVEGLRFFAQCFALDSIQRAGGITEWSVKASATWTHPVTVESDLLHDDHFCACALVATLDDEQLAPAIAQGIHPARRRRSDDED